MLVQSPKVVSTNQQTLHKELEHIKKAIQACSFPPWTFNKLPHNFYHKHNINNGQSSMVNQPNNNTNNNNKSGTSNSNNNKNISILVPYLQGIGERFKMTCNNKGIQVHFKGTNTIKTLLMAPKDRDNKLQKSRVIYKFKCPDINCPEEYIGESGRTFVVRLKEHLRTPSPIHHHSNSTGHSVSPECFTTVNREP